MADFVPELAKVMSKIWRTSVPNAILRLVVLRWLGKYSTYTSRFVGAVASHYSEVCFVPRITLMKYGRMFMSVCICIKMLIIYSALMQHVLSYHTYLDHRSLFRIRNKEVLGDVCHREDIAGVVVRHFGNDGVRDREGWEAKLGGYYFGEERVV